MVELWILWFYLVQIKTVPLDSWIDCGNSLLLVIQYFPSQPSFLNNLQVAMLVFVCVSGYLLVRSTPYYNSKATRAMGIVLSVIEYNCYSRQYAEKSCSRYIVLLYNLRFNFVHQYLPLWLPTGMYTFLLELLIINHLMDCKGRVVLFVSHVRG